MKKGIDELREGLTKKKLSDEEKGQLKQHVGKEAQKLINEMPSFMGKRKATRYYFTDPDMLELPPKYLYERAFHPDGWKKLNAGTAVRNLEKIGFEIDRFNIFYEKWHVLNGGSHNKLCERAGSLTDAGVYVIGYGNKLEGKRVTPVDICYVGYTSRGIKVRLREFLESANGKNTHSGGMRFFKECGGPYAKLKNGKKIYFAAVRKKIDKDNEEAERRAIGTIRKSEYDIISEIIHSCGEMPYLNKQ